MGLTKTFRDGSTPTIAIIGAGMSGLCAAIQLQRQLQLTTYTIFELESDVGGTWLSNTYPGCQSDAPIHVYSYSFAPNYDFSKKFAPQSEILEYVQATAKTYNIYDKIQFRTRISSMQWHEGRSKWILSWVRDASAGEKTHGTFEADVVVHAAGVLRVPGIPKELEAFKGPKWHSARWDHSVDLSGKRVGVVGTSASGIQIVSAISSKVKSMEVYGRTPSYITPQLNISYNRVWRFLFQHVPFFFAAYRMLERHYMDSTVILYHKMAWFSVFHRIFVYLVTWIHLFRHFPLDPKMRRKLRPEYEIASRRIVLSDTFYLALQQPQVHLHQDPIVSIKGKTIETQDGGKRELDALILATGFDKPSNFPIGYWKGRRGIDIAQSWGGNTTTYYGTCVPHAPNFFLLWGPGTAVPHHTITSMVEIQVMYIVRTLSHMMENDLATMEIKQAAADEFLELQDRRMEHMIYTTKIMPKFLNAKGKCRGLWFGSVAEFWWRMQRLYPERYNVTERHGPRDQKPHLNGVYSDDDSSEE